MRKLSVVLLALALVAPVAAAAAADAWSVDPNHTEVNFEVSHFFTPVTGSFGDYEIDLQFDPENVENSRVAARIAVASVDTGNDRRDQHLRSGDFFEAESHPWMTFESTSVEQVSDTELVARGPLSIKGQTRQVELPITLLGVKDIPPEMQDMLGGAQQVASFRASTTLDRGDFGVGVGNWAATLVVGGEVDVEILLEAALR